MIFEDSKFGAIIRGIIGATTPLDVHRCAAIELEGPSPSIVPRSDSPQNKPARQFNRYRRCLGCASMSIHIFQPLIFRHRLLAEHGVRKG